MANELAIVERELTGRLPAFADVLPPGMAPQRIMRTTLVSIERNPRLLECGPQSIINSAMTAAVLGLEVDGVTGQGFLVPYAKVATFQVGYKGFNTIGARAGITITGGIYREGDFFEYEEGSAGFVRHKKSLEPIGNRKMIAAWATAAAHNRPAIVVVMPMDEVLQIKGKSQGARKPDSPWNDTAGPGFAAMCEKTAKRRLARSTPLTLMQVAAALEDQHDLGRAAYVEPDRTLRVIGEESLAEGPVAAGTLAGEQPADLLSAANPGARKIVFPSFASAKDFQTYSRRFLKDATPDQAEQWHEHHKGKLGEYGQSANEALQAVATELVGLYHERTK